MGIAALQSFRFWPENGIFPAVGQTNRRGYPFKFPTYLRLVRRGPRPDTGRNRWGPSKSTLEITPKDLCDAARSWRRLPRTVPEG